MKPNLTWNFRLVVEHEIPSGTLYQIYRVFYKEGVISGYSNPYPPLGDTIEELQEEMKLMQEAFTRPVLTLLNNDLIDMEDSKNEADLNSHENQPTEQ